MTETWITFVLLVALIIAVCWRARPGDEVWR